MRATLVVAHAGSVYVLSPGTPPRGFELAKGRTGGPTAQGGLPPAALDALRNADPGAPIVVCGQELLTAVAPRLARPVGLADRTAWHVALGALPAPEPRAERAAMLARARADLDAALRSPEELLVSLAREEQRFGRSEGREERAAEAFVAPVGTVLADLDRRWRQVRERLTEHHAELDRLLEAEARRSLPNLSALVGPRTAARLAAAAGGLAPLARMSASRLQLLGTRRRPSPERGPRYGAIYLADTVDAVPDDRRAAFARSLAALAAIAVRADVLTHRDLSATLVRRRDLRRERLLRRGR